MNTNCTIKAITAALEALNLSRPIELTNLRALLKVNYRWAVQKLDGTHWAFRSWYLSLTSNGQLETIRYNDKINVPDK